MSDLAAPLPEGLGGKLTAEGVGERPAVVAGVGRRQVIGLLFVVFGLLLLFALAPNLTSELRTFAF